MVTSLKRDCWQHFFSSCGCPPTQCGPDQIFEERTCECRSLLSARIRTTWFIFVGMKGNKSAVADAKTAVVEANAWSSTTKNGTLQLARAGDTRTWDWANAHQMDKWANMQKCFANDQVPTWGVQRMQHWVQVSDSFEFCERYTQGGDPSRKKTWIWPDYQADTTCGASLQRIRPRIIFSYVTIFY